MELSDHESDKEDLAQLQQQSLLESSLPLVFEAYDAALQDGVVCPVVLLLDCEDPIGGEIARAWLGAESVGEAIAERESATQAAEETTVFAHAFPLEQCREEIPRVFDYLAPVFQEQPPEDGFWAVSVTCGGASALTVPAAARQEIENHTKNQE